MNKKKAREKPVWKETVKVDLLLERLMEKADVSDDTSGTIAACNVLKKLKLAECSFWTSKSEDGTFTEHYIFIATEELRELLTSLSMLNDYI